VPTSNNYFHLHLVSDSTGETLITVARAVAAQYANVTPVEHVYPLVRSQKQLDRVLDEIEEAPGIVLFTLLEKDLVSRLEDKCKQINVPSLSMAMSGVHGFFSRWCKDFAADRRPRSQKFYRIINEVPTALMILIVIMVIVKPF
jgi:regulator of PEP synthase PpsR (kinase-PPPase family)